MGFNRAVVSNIAKILCMLTSLLVTSYSFSGDLQLKANVKSTAYFYQTQRGELPKEQTEALAFEPSMTGIYDSKKLGFAVNVAHTLVEQSSSAEGADKSYTDVKLNSSLNMLENALKFTVTGAQNYRVTSESSGEFNDKILSAGELSQVQQYSTSLGYTSPNPSYIGIGVLTSYSNLSTEKTINQDLTGLDAENINLFTRIHSGKKLNLITFDFSSQHNDTKRSEFNNFKSDSLNGNIRLNVTKQLNIVMLGSQSNYDFDQASGLGRRNIDTTSYGAGVQLSNSDNRSVQITYNSIEEGNNKTNYVGIDLNWAFSPRTSVDFNYSKRFYGDAYTLNAKYNLKYFRSNLSYSEDVTTYSRLSFETDSLGIFVCTIGSTELVDCFQPADLDYELQPGEEFRSYNNITTDITNEVILAKSARYGLGYTKRKVKISFDLSYREMEYLESSRLQRSKSAGLTTNYQLNKNMNVGMGVKILLRDSNVSTNDDDTLSANFSIERALSTNAKLNLAFRYIDRQSENENRDITDKRLTVGFNYQF